jgi:hypothetical protein
MAHQEAGGWPVDSIFDGSSDPRYLPREVGIYYSGNLVRIDQDVETRYGLQNELVIALDSITDDGYAFGRVGLGAAGSQAHRALASACRKAGIESLRPGDWVRIGVREKVSTKAGGLMNIWHVEVVAKAKRSDSPVAQDDSVDSDTAPF